MLHILNKSPFSLSSCLDAFALLNKGDVLLLIEDGVYNALIGSAYLLKNSDISIFALQDDIIARGIQNKLLPEVKLIDYKDFVELTIQYYPINNW
jgi:tRNA 2-thiouridine synthesizing protein B